MTHERKFQRLKRGQFGVKDRIAHRQLCIRTCTRVFFFFSSRRRHTRWNCDWSSDVCSSDLGANADVMRLLLEIGKDATPEKAEEAIRAKLARKEKIPGFGHRVYHTEDPRATHLRQMSRDLGQRAGQPQWFEMSQRIEALVKGEKKLNPNVDFYSASTYYVLGIPIDLFTPIFAVSRVSGWTAHVLEQYSNNRLIRPRADYIGPDYPQRYTPLETR